jgi:biopolymer transport protein TolR
MGMGVGGGKGGPQADINMTPMIDVLLVLLIIFMVVQQGLQRGVSVQIPPPKDKNEVAQKPDPNSTIVLEVEPGPTYFINRQPVDPSQLRERIAEVFVSRPRKIIFVKGAENMTYGQVVRAVDASRAAGVEIVGLVPRPDVGAATAVAPPAA